MRVYWISKVVHLFASSSVMDFWDLGQGPRIRSRPKFEFPVAREAYYDPAASSLLVERKRVSTSVKDGGGDGDGGQRLRGCYSFKFMLG